ncbi:uncharacterized protein LOC123543279 [Mercenaria mercenaria]|uniref:uncharacterized protein LOC123543279 n=1 Tax=Mercenaria mercenaria TaxID=6596 RepID=UPI00234F4804|nr:uncharacterized protein LOC123543279 [Mercenaria mercenaria]
MTTTIGTESSSQMLTGYTSKQTEQKHDITTSEVLASATSQHTMKTTTPSSFGSYVIYDKSSNIKINAVIVDKDVCYVYHLTDTEVKLVNMGSSIREAFERALLSKDRTTVLQNPLYITGAANQVQQTCKGTVFLLV